MFRALPCSSSGDISRNYIYIYIYMQPLVSSLSAGDCTMHRLRRNCSTKFLKFVSFRNNTLHLDEWLTVHRSVTFVDFHLVAKNSYLFIYNTFIKILYMFRALPWSSLGGLRRNCMYMQPLVSSLSAGDCPVHRLRRNCSFFLTGAQDSHLQRATIPEAAYIYNYDVYLLKMSRVMLETCRGFE